MNPGGLSPEAQVRRLRHAEGHGADLPVPPLDDFAAVERWRRAQHADWGEGLAPGEPPHRSIVVGGVSALRAGSPGDPTLLYLHGGGFCLGSAGTAIPITARLAARLDVTSLNYRLAPEHPFPAALDDADAAFQAMAAKGPVAVGGDSAGANLALALALRLADSAVRPAALVLLSPHLDLQPRGSTSIDAMMSAYRGAAAVDHPLVSPAKARDSALAGLPPVLVQTTPREAHFAAAAAFAARCPEGSTTLHVWDGLWHAWHYHRELPEADDALHLAAEWLRALA